MTRRFQFSLASLLLATALIAIAVNWWTLRQRVVAAQERFDEAAAFYEVGAATPASLRKASKELLQAELAMPFVPSDRVAWLSYLDRTRIMFQKQHALARYAMLGSDEGQQKLADELLQECRDVEDRFGLPHIDEKFSWTHNDGRQNPLSKEPDMADDDSLPADEIAPPAPDEREQ